MLFQCSKLLRKTMFAPTGYSTLNGHSHSTLAIDQSLTGVCASHLLTPRPFTTHHEVPRELPFKLYFYSSPFILVGVCLMKLLISVNIFCTIIRNMKIILVKKKIKNQCKVNDLKCRESLNYYIYFYVLTCEFMRSL